MTPMPDRGYWVCDYCLTFSFPHGSPDDVQDFGQATDRTCPICTHPLTAGRLEGQPVEYCANCHGMLMRQGVFSRVIEMKRSNYRGEKVTSRQPLNRQELQREIRCPGCQNPFSTHPYYGPGRVVVDTCPHCCLIWLDAGEMSIIEKA